MIFQYEVDSQILPIMNYLMTQGDMKQDYIALRLVSFNTNGVNIFQGLKFGVIVQI